MPADDEAAEFIAKMKTGQGVTGAFRKLRNVRFHRKVFNLSSWHSMRGKVTAKSNMAA